MPTFDAFEEGRDAVLADLRNGLFDYLEVASRVTEARFFRYLLEEGDLASLAATYPTPRKKEEVPLWIYLASQISLRLHGQHSYSTYPFVLHCGGLRDALGPGQAKLTEEPGAGRRRLSCKGFNKKNHYERTTPCDQDFLRKLAKDTRPEALMGWFGTAVAKYLSGLGAYDEEGVFLIDGTYLFVPDNERYEKSARLRFDEHNHPIGKEQFEKLTERQKDKTRWRRCYRAVFLMHLDKKERSYPFAAFSLMGGKEAETPQMRILVDRFVSAVGKGVVKTLVFDRGFIDGPTITHMKKEHGIDSVFPLRSNMLDAKDAWVLAEADEGPWTKWRPPPRPELVEPVDRPEPVRRRERKRQETLARRRAEEATEEKAGAEPDVEMVEMKLLPATGLWDELKVPLWVAPCRETKTDGKVSTWCLASTREPSSPLEVFLTYKLRTAVEERNRQLKCFWDLTDFPSRAFSLITAQVGFVLLAYSLLQTFFRRISRGEMNAKTRERILNELLWQDDRLVLYSGNRFAYFVPLEYQEILLRMPEGSRRRILARTQKLRESMIQRASRTYRPER